MKQEAAAFTRAVHHLSDNSCLHPINEDSKEHRQHQRSMSEQAIVELSRSAACGAIASLRCCRVKNSTCRQRSWLLAIYSTIAAASSESTRNPAGDRCSATAMASR